MICSRCGTNNAKTSKFCRECGSRLIVESLELENGVASPAADSPDEQAVSDLLYDALKLYERGNLEEAFGKCRLALGINPASTSARSLLAVIYEKKADDQAMLGNKDDADDYYSAAIRQIERVLESNPGSIADQEKLNSLKAKLSGKIHVARKITIIDTVRTRLKRIPVPVAATGGTVILVFLLILIIFGGHRSRTGPANLPPAPSGQTGAPRFATAPPQTGTGTAATPQMASPYPQAAPAQPQTGYTYPAPQPQAPAYAPQAGRQGQIPVIQAEPVRPVSPLPGPRTPDGTTVAKPKVEPPASAQPAQPADNTPPAAPDRSTVEDAHAAYNRGDYQSASSLFRQAISEGADTAENNQFLGMSLSNAGRSAEARSRFERALDMYKARGDMAGARTCQRYIDLLPG